MRNKTALWFALALALQLLILIGVSAQQFIARTTGRSVVLKVQPVDPYSILSGYYVTLGYEISSNGGFPRNAGEPNTDPNPGGIVYAIVERQDDGLWHPVELASSLPTSLPENRMVIRGRYVGGRIEYGIEQFYIPESKRDVINKDLREHLGDARVELKVDADGNAALVKLLIEDRVYGN
ncbi:MAG: GDYXXLXY domain-containing protein [Blastocatellia bacterium]